MQYLNIRNFSIKVNNRYRKKSCLPVREGIRGTTRAGDGTRTRDVQLGKLAFYH
jgi:hypothetical protein